MVRGDLASADVRSAALSVVGDRVTPSLYAIAYENGRLHTTRDIGHPPRITAVRPSRTVQLYEVHWLGPALWPHGHRRHCHSDLVVALGSAQP